MPSGIRIGPMDRALLAAGDHPFMTGLYLDIPGPAPSLDMLRARVEERMASLPALHLTAGPGSTEWSRVTPDLDVHVQQLSCPVGTLDAETHRTSIRALPPAPAPLWDLWLLTEPGADRYRLCLRFHHGLMEGTGIAHTTIALLGDTRVPGPYMRPPGRPTPAAAARIYRDMISSAGRENEWPELSTHINGPATWSYTDIESARLTAVARRAGGTVNDVFLAALTRTFHAWHELVRPDAPGSAPDLPVQMPMALRQEGEEYAVGNRLVVGRLRLPVSADDPRAVLDRIIHETSQFSAIRYRDTFSRLLALPGAIRMILRPGGPYVHASHINIPGPLTCFGSLVAVAHRVPTSLGATFFGLTRINGMARLGVIHDLSLPHGTSLPTLWLDAITELEHAVPADSASALS